MEEWSVRDRLDALTASVNTLSGIVALLECGDKPRSTTQIHKRIAEYGFGADPDTFGAITYGPLRDKLAFQSDEFTLVDSYEETRPPTKGRGGRIEPTEVTVFEKGPRGYWFGDPVAARVLTVCADCDLTPTEIFTSAEQKGETRAPVTTAILLHVLTADETISEKELLCACYWEPTDREEYRNLRHRLNKNVERLTDVGILLKESHQETVIRYTGEELGTYPRRTDGSRIISETDRILSYFNDRGEVRRQALIEDVRSYHTQSILNHLREEGVVEWIRGGMDDRSRITLTETGNTVKERVIEPLFQAVAPDVSLAYDSRAESERAWNATPPVDEEYLVGAFRDQLRTYCDNPTQYQADVTAVNQVDQEQNPWR